ncbi:MAG: polysaccharide biosynthesis tyrosine autokinase [Planctomycetes bacterium]|nr:polysaccharide biosynthesis tyrosine autokinase [Planctomycetota bacterium]
MTSIPANQPLTAPRPVGAPAPSAQAAGGPLIDPVRVLQQYYPWLLLSGVAGAIVGTVLHFALLFIYPIYTGYVVFECSPPYRAGEGSTASAAATPQVKEELQLYMETQVSVMRSDVVLKRALEQPQFRETKWAQSYLTPSGAIEPVEALKELRKIVGSYVVPETALIRLQVRTQNRQDAAIIATAIKDVYLEDNRQQTNRATTNLLTLTSDKVKELESDIRNLDNSMENLLQVREITTLEQQSNERFVEIVQLQPQIVELRDTRAKAQEQLDTYDNLAKNPAGVVYPEAIRSAAETSRVAEELKAQIAQVQARLNSDKQEFGEEHGQVKRGERLIVALQSERQRMIETIMADEFASQRETLRNTVQNTEAALSQLSDRLEQARTKLRDTTIAIKQYREFALTREEKLKLKSEFEARAVELALLQQRGTRVRQLNEAEPPDTPSFPQAKILIPLTAVAIVGLTAGFIVLKEAREQRIRSPQDVAMIPRTRPLGFVPELAMDPTQPPKIETATVDKPEGIVAESYRQIRTNILKACQAKGYRTVLVTSGLPGSGSTSLVSNLAASAGSLGLNVLIIDTNVRRPGVHGALGVSEGPGLSEILKGQAAFASSVVATKIENVSVLPAGKDRKGVHERFATKEMAGVLNDAREKYDLVLLDTAPSVVAGDAVTLSGLTDAAVLVVRAYSEKRGLVARLRNQLGEHKAEFLGVIVNAVQASAGGYFKKNFEQAMEYQRAGESSSGSKAA